MRAGFDLKYSVLRLKFDLFHFYGVRLPMPRGRAVGAALDAQWAPRWTTTKE